MVESSDLHERLHAQMMSARARYDRLHDLLLLWASWMRHSGFAFLDLPNRSPIIGISHGADFDQIADQAENATARTVNAVIHDLSILERQALHSEYLGATWNSIANHNVVLVLARESVRSGLRRKGVI